MRQITYHIHRYQQGRAFVQTFKFDYEADRTILWGLQKIKDTQDPTLTFLAACRSAVLRRLLHSRKWRSNAWLRS